MTKKTRVTLFLSCLSLFFLASALTIFYSQGYRFDFKTKRVVQTGGFFLKVDPKPAMVFVNEKLKRKTDFFFGTVLIKNLLPEKYNIRVEKEGFFSWQKNLEIKEKEVTEAKSVVLIPKNFGLNVLAKGLKNFWAYPDGKKFILLKQNEEGWIISSYILENGRENYLIKEKDISEGAEIVDLKFSVSQEKILLEARVKNKLKNIILDIDKIPPALSDATTSEIESFFDFRKVNDDIYSLDKSGYLLKNGEKLIDAPFKSFEISPDSKKIALIQGNEIWVLFLAPQFNMPQRKSLEKVYLTRFSKKVGEIFWYNSDYLIFRVGGQIKITEIDNRDGLNIVDVIDFGETTLSQPKIFFDQFNKKLYILNKNNFFVSEKLLP